MDRADPLSLRKLEGDGTPSERKLVLGWLLDTREFKIYLPMDKAIGWIAEIKEILAPDMKVKTKQIESTIGRLNHVGYILPQGRYFLNRIRYLQKRCEKYGPQKISKLERKDFELWIEFLENASQVGVNLNLISFTKPDCKIYTDASSHGMGGYNKESGLAWRYELPKWMAHTFHINTLEFISAMIGIWIEVLNKEDDYLKINCLTDNSSAIGWLFKTNFDPNKQQKHDIIARKMAKILLDSESALRPQHIPGEENIIADSLSRDFHLSTNHLQFALKSLYPNQAQKNFKILTKLPQKIICWLESLRESKIKPEESLPAPSRSKMGVLLDGSDSLHQLASKINSWTALAKQGDTQSCPRLQRLCAETNRARLNETFSEAGQSVRPSIMYVRYFEQTFGGHQSLTKTEK